MHRCITPCTCALVVILSSTGHAAEWYVDDDADGGIGTTWATAFKTLNDALDNSSLGTGDVIFVAQGIYFPDEGGDAIPDFRGSTFSLPTDVHILGGYSGVTSPGNEDSRNFDTRATILSGDLQQDGSATQGTRDDNTYTVVTGEPGVLESLLVEGFTITGGAGDTVDRQGAGIRIRGEGTFQSCRIVGNYSEVFAGEGAGVGSSGETKKPVFRFCTIEGNTSGLIGGGVFLHLAVHPMIVNTLFVNNVAAAGAGLASQKTPFLEVINSTFANNEAVGPAQLSFDLGGGAVLIWESENQRISNSILWDNTSWTEELDPMDFPEFVDDTGEIFISENGIGGPMSSLTVEDSDVDGGLVGVVVVGNVGSPAWVSNIDDDPLYGGGSGPTSTGGNYRLQSGSPCRNTGNDTHG